MARATVGEARERGPAGARTAARARPAPGLRGREVELAAVDAHLDALQGGWGGVLLLEGPAGSGRTRLLDEALARARRRGVATCRGAAHPGAGAVPLGPLLEALLDGEPPVLDPERARAAAALADPRFWQLREMEERLQEAASAAPLVVGVDDVGWADDATRLALRTLPRRLVAHPVLWVLAGGGRPGAAPVEADRVVLAALGAGAVRDLAAEVLGAAPGRAVLDLAGALRGDPALLVALLEGLREEGGVALREGRAELVGGPLPRRLRDAVAARLADLPAAARAIVEAASALGPRFTAGQLALLLGRPPGALVGPVQDALAAGLLAEDGDALAVASAPVRDAVAGALPAALRHALRREAASLLLEHGAPAAEVAPLLLEGARPGDHEAVAVLRRAAAELAPSAPAAAARMSRRALELTPYGDPERAVAAADTIPFLLAAGEAAEARELAGAALDGALAPEAEAELRLALAELSLHDAPAAAARECRRALALPGLPDRLRLRLRAALVLARFVDGDWEALGAAAGADLAAARELGAGGVARRALLSASAAAWTRQDHAAALAHADEADALEDAADHLAPLGRGRPATAAWRAWLRGALGPVDEALPVVDEGVRLAERAGRSAEVRLWLAARCRLLLAAGRVPEARAAAQALLRAAGDAPEAAPATLHARYVLGRVAIHTGDGDGLRRAGDAARALRGATSPGARRAGAWLGALVADAEGDHARARAHAQEVLGALGRPAPAFAEPADADDLLRLLRLVLRSGDRGAGAAVVGEAERRAARSPGVPVPGLLAGHARGLLERDPEAVRASVAALPVLPGDLCRAEVLEDAAGLLAPTSRAEAVACLDDALVLLDAAGCRHDAGRVRRRLRELGVRRRRTADPGAPGWGALTPSELAVVVLVAGGATNRRAAERLFLSPHTVSSHLRHAFDKLGIRSRVELARLHAEHARDG